MSENISAEERLWTQFSGRLRSFVARRVPPGIEPDDIVQEVFVRVVRHLDGLRETDRIEAWLFQIARNAILDALRARRRRDSRTEPLETDVPVANDVEQIRGEAELTGCLSPMVARLAEPYRTAIELTAHQGLTQTDAAKRLGMSTSGMKSRVQRAREQLRAMLLQCCVVQLDVRGAVLDYHLRDRVRPSGACGVSSVEGEDKLRHHSGGIDMPNEATKQNVQPAGAGTCCGGAAPAGTDACCVRDAEVKATGGSGCGCGTAPAAAKTASPCCG